MQVSKILPQMLGFIQFLAMSILVQFNIDAKKLDLKLVSLR